MKKFLISIVALFLISCSKTTLVNNDTSGNQVQTQNDGLSMPLKKGNSWKYQRIDTSVIQIGSGTISTSYKTDSSEETMTIKGDTLIPAIDPVNRLFILSIQNINRNTIDTNFILYTKDKFSVYGHLITLKASFYSLPANSQVFALNFDSISTKSNQWDLLTRVSLPIINTPFRLLALNITKTNPYNINDTICTRSDTSILVAGVQHSQSVYANYAIGTMGVGQNQIGGGFYEYTSFIKPGLGIVFTKQYPFLSDGVLNSLIFTTSWTTRRLKSAVLL